MPGQPPDSSNCRDQEQGNDHALIVVAVTGPCKPPLRPWMRPEGRASAPHDSPSSSGRPRLGDQRLRESPGRGNAAQAFAHGSSSSSRIPRRPVTGTVSGIGPGLFRQRALRAAHRKCAAHDNPHPVQRSCDRGQGEDNSGAHQHGSSQMAEAVQDGSGQMAQESARTRAECARPGGRIGHGHPVGCASGQWTFSALLSSKKLVFPPLTSVPTNLRVMVWPMYEARLVVYST